MANMIDPKSLNWENFDQVNDLLADFAEKSKDSGKLKDANEALGQLLGVTDKPVFRRMTVEQQNNFLQYVVDQHAKFGLGAADVAQKLLEGLQLKTPQLAPSTPAPVFGISAPTPFGPGGSGGGMSQPQQPQQPTQAPPSQQQQENTGWVMPPLPPEEDDKK